MVVSQRPLWLIGAMFAGHLAWMAFCALYVPMKVVGVSPFFVPSAILWTYALAPLVASFSKLGREYWDLLGRLGAARRAAGIYAAAGAVTALLAIAVRHLA